MTVNELISVCSLEENFQIMNYSKQNDDFGEKVYFSGNIWTFVANDSLLKKYGERTVRALTMGLFSLIVAV